MKFLFGLILLVFATALFAETQEEAYYRAMKFEESGDIPAAIQAFEEAAALPGEYTEEIQEIIREYKAALGDTSSDSAGLDNAESSWKFHVAGELGLYGLHYKETGMDEGEKGGDLFLNVNPYLDYVSRKWSHTFAASVQADYFLNNDNMPLLDTNDWNLVLGLEYTLIGRGMLLDVGYDFNIEGEELSSDFLLWFEKDWYRFEKQRIGTVAWAFYRTSGPMSFAFYASWHRTAAEGLNGTVYLGAKFEADSAFDYKALDQSLKEYGQAYEEYYQSKEIYEWSGGTTELLEEPSLESLVFRQTLGSWLGPVFRPRISYKFKNRIAVEANVSLFYGFAVDGPDEEYKKIKRFDGSYGVTVSWQYWKMNFYLGLDRKYKRYNLPRYYQGKYTESYMRTQLKLGAKWDI